MAEMETTWMHAFLSMLTGFVCAMLGLFFLMRTMQRRQVKQHVAADQEQQYDPGPGPTVTHDHEEGHTLRRLRHMDPDEMDESAEPEPDDAITNTDTTVGNSPPTGDRAGDLARLMRLHGLPGPYERYSPEHMLLWLIIRGQGRIARCEHHQNRRRLWQLRVNSLIELLHHVRTCIDPSVRQRAMTTLLDAGDFSDDDDSPFNGETPDHRHSYIEEVQNARDFADHVIGSFQARGAGPDVTDDLMENMEEESPTSDVTMDEGDNNYGEMIGMHGQRRRTMQTYRLNHQAAIEMGDMEEAAMWESMENDLLFH